MILKLNCLLQQLSLKMLSTQLFKIKTTMPDFLQHQKHFDFGHCPCNIMLQNGLEDREEEEEKSNFNVFK